MLHTVYVISSFSLLIHNISAQMATSACSQLNLTGVRLNECIFDVAVTNDTSLTEQEAFKIGKVVRRLINLIEKFVKMFCLPLILLVRMSNSMFWQRPLC